MSFMFSVSSSLQVDTIPCGAGGEGLMRCCTTLATLRKGSTSVCAKNLALDSILYELTSPC